MSETTEIIPVPTPAPQIQADQEHKHPLHSSTKIIRSLKVAAVFHFSFLVGLSKACQRTIHHLLLHFKESERQLRCVVPATLLLDFHIPPPPETPGLGPSTHPGQQATCRDPSHLGAELLESSKAQGLSKHSSLGSQSAWDTVIIEGAISKRGLCVLAKAHTKEVRFG